jgi:hypothetical protein
MTPFTVQVEEMHKLRKANHTFRYVVFHYSRTKSYYNYYPTKLSAYWEAINPRYWGCHTVVMLDIIVPEKPKPDYSDVT